MRVSDQIIDFWNVFPQMPYHTPNYAAVPHPYGHFPKNAMEHSALVDNKFLNDNLATVEEIAHRDKSNPIPKWFGDYQVGYFASHGILAHDCFFASRLRDGYRKHLLPNFSEIREIGRFGSTRGYFVEFGNFGLDIEMGDTSAHSTPGSTIIHYCSPTTGSTGTVGKLYDQIAANVFSSANNAKIACYDEGSTNPNNKIGGEVAFALDGAFTWRSVTQFALTTTKIWLAYQPDSATGADIYYNNADTGLRRQETHTYANPFPATATPSANDGLVFNMKIGHS